MSKELTYLKTLADVANALQLPYSRLYKLKHRPEFQKTARGYNVKKINAFLTEQEQIREEEEKEQSLLGAEEELLEKQIKLETARHKCRLLELQIAQKEGNLVDVNAVLETRSKELSRLRRGLQELVLRIPVETANKGEEEIRACLSAAVNVILSDLSEFIADDWSDRDPVMIDEEEEQ